MKTRNIPYLRENSSLNSLTGFNNTSVGGISNHISGTWNTSEYSVAVECSGTKILFPILVIHMLVAQIIY